MAAPLPHAVITCVKHRAVKDCWILSYSHCFYLLFFVFSCLWICSWNNMTVYSGCILGTALSNFSGFFIQMAINEMRIWTCTAHRSLSYICSVYCWCCCWYWCVDTVCIECIYCCCNTTNCSSLGINKVYHIVILSLCVCVYSMSSRDTTISPMQVR